MTGIVIGASLDAVHGIKVAQSLGHGVIAIDGDEDAQGLAFADYKMVTDIKEPLKVIEALNSLEKSKNVKPGFIIPVPIGRYLVTTGYVRDYYGFKGLGYEGSSLCTDKHEFHMEMSKNGLRQIGEILIPKGDMAKDMGELILNKMADKLPVIIKPRHGSGSRGVSRIDDLGTLVDEVVNKLPFEEDYIMEGVIKGKEYGIDGVVIDGGFKLVLLRDKVMTPPPARQCIAYMNVVRNNENEELFGAIESYMEKAAKVMKMRDCLLHADLMVECENGINVSAIEISGRPSGHRLHDVFTPLACGVDVIREFVCYCCGEGYDFTPANRSNMVIRYFDFEDCRIKWQPGIDDLVKKYDIVRYACNIKEDEYLGRVVDGHSIMDRGYFILEGSDAGEALKKSQEIMDMFITS